MQCCVLLLQAPLYPMKSVLSTACRPGLTLMADQNLQSTHQHWTSAIQERDQRPMIPTQECCQLWTPCRQMAPSGHKSGKSYGWKCIKVGSSHRRRSGRLCLHCLLFVKDAWQPGPSCAQKPTFLGRLNVTRVFLLAAAQHFRLVRLLRWVVWQKVKPSRLNAPTPIMINRSRIFNLTDFDQNIMMWAILEMQQ